jgi:uncharacterized protein (DUF2141 family)
MFALYLRMYRKNLAIFIALCCFAYMLSVLGSGCAQIVAPTGGPRDSLPPVLVAAEPANGTLNFKDNRITLTYDEYVQLDPKLQQTLLITPTPKINPNITYKFKTITIKIRDTLQPNTTYRFDLGNSIADLNEGNAVKNYSYVFSTGPYIDSLTLAGNVQLAQTGKPDSTLLVFLYKDLGDSAVFKQKPRYITRVNATGDFRFHNLPGGIYNIFALKDESGQKVYNGKDEIFAFADSTVKIGDTAKKVKLFAYAEEKPKVKSTLASGVVTDKKLKYTVSASGGGQDLLKPLTIEFNHKLKNFDSLKIVLADTLLNPFKGVRVSLDSTRKVMIVKYQWLDNATYKLILPKDFATDTLGTGLTKSDTIRFKTKKETDYGSIKITFKNLSKFRNPVLQFVTNNEVANSYPLSTTVWNAKLFTPGDYEIRILEDLNGNGTWDPGNYHLKLQPEKVYTIPQKINIRADWDNERDIIL